MNEQHGYDQWLADSERLIRLEMHSEKNAKDLEAIGKKLDGNGNIGLIKLVDRLYSFMEGQVWFHRIVITAVAMQAVAVIIAAVIWALKRK